MSDSEPNLNQPLSLAELHDLRRRILHEGYEPDVATMQRVVQSICASRPTPEEKPKRKSSGRAPKVDVDFSDLI